MSSQQQVRASHLLIKHSGSRRKASWKDPEGQIIKNTSRDSAVAQLKSLREQIISGQATFKDLASLHSDCSSAKRGGDLGNRGKPLCAHAHREGLLGVARCRSLLKKPHLL